MTTGPLARPLYGEQAKRGPLLVAAVVVVSVGILAIPVKQTCGSAGVDLVPLPVDVNGL